MQARKAAERRAAANGWARMTARSPQAPAGNGRTADTPRDVPLAGWKQIVLRTWRESAEDNVGIIAAGVAFYGFVALVPLLGALVLTYGLFADPETVVRHAAAMTAILPGEAAALVGQQLLNVVETSGGKKGLGLLAALVVALWGARKAAGAIIKALNIAYEEEEKRGFIAVTLLALGMTVAAIFLALLAGGAIAVLGALHRLFPATGEVGLALWKTLTYVLLAGTAAGAAASLYRYGPSRDRAKWRWLTPGSIFFAATWILLTLGFGFYVSNIGNYGATYGSLGAVVILLTWLYFSAYVLLFGAEFNSEVEHQTARDTTRGPDQPLGARGAWSADHVAGEENEAAPEPAEATPAKPASVEPEPAVGGHPYIASRLTSRAGRMIGGGKVGMVGSALATLGLALLARRGREGVGAALLGGAVGLSLLRRS